MIDPATLHRRARRVLPEKIGTDAVIVEAMDDATLTMLLFPLAHRRRGCLLFRLSSQTIAALVARTAGYLHLMPFGDTILVGGGCTDGNVLRILSPARSDAVNAAGGILLHLLRHAFANYGDRCEAFLGYCGDPRAEEVDLRAGFVKTQHPHLLVHFHKPRHEVMQRALIAKGAAIGAF